MVMLGVHCVHGRDTVEWIATKRTYLGMTIYPNHRPIKAPNPLAFIALCSLSFGAFFYLTKHQEAINPASKKPRQLDHPLVPPRHKDTDIISSP